MANVASVLPADQIVHFSHATPPVAPAAHDDYSAPAAHATYIAPAARGSLNVHGVGIAVDEAA